MKIYFEDGKLVGTNRLPIIKVDFTVDATYGVSDTINILDELKQRETEDGESLVIYTNSIFAFPYVLFTSSTVKPSNSALLTRVQPFPK